MRRLSRWVFVALLLAHFIVLSRQVAGRRPGGTLAERAVVGVVGPVASGVTGGESFLEGVTRRWRSYRGLQSENERLRGRVGALERELLRREAVTEDFQRLAAALDYERRSGTHVAVADVVYVDYTSFLRSMILRVGEQGARPGQPVVGPDGLIGRVVAVGGGYAKVQLLTDRASAVGAMIARTHRQGVVRGQDPNTLALSYVPQQADVRIGDRVVTAGIDGVYPRGLAIGVVSSVEPGPQLFHRIEVAPAVDFGVLDQVYLLPPEATPTPADLELPDDAG